MLATQIEVSDGTLNIVNVGIEFFNQADISVSLDLSDPLVLGVDYQWSAATTIQFLNTVNTPGGLVPNGVEVLLRRDTKNDEMYNIFDGGAPFTRLALDEDYKQLLFLSQEFSEGLGLDGLRNSLDMHGNRIINLGTPQAAGDAANKDYVDTSVQKTLRTPENIPVLPPAATRASKVLAFDGLGDPIVSVPVSGSAAALAIDLADPVDPTLGAQLVGRASLTVASISALLTNPTAGNRSVRVISYFPGSEVGGGVFMWDATKAKSLHDGGTIISPTVPWAGTFASLNAFLLGTGETTPAGFGCWVRQDVKAEIHADWFGATVGDVSKDNSFVLTALHKAAIARTAPIMPVMVLPSGELTYSVSPNYAQVHAMRLRGKGLDGTRLRYTGSGAALLCDSSAYGITFRTGFEASDMLIDLNANGMAAVRLVNVDRAQLVRVMSLNGAATSLHFDLQLAVLCHFDSCGMTVNRWPVTSYPQEVFRLAASALGQNTTACTFVNCSGEGATLANWRFLGADFNVTVGGTGEAATGAGRGVLFGSVVQCKGNVLIGMTMEANPGGDVLLDGLSNKLVGGYGISTGPGVIIANSARGCMVEGTVCHNFAVQSGALNCIVKGLKYNAKGGGTFSDLGTGTDYGPIYNMTASLYEYPRKASFGISATLNAFVYANNTTDTVQVFIRPGGGVAANITQILYQRTVGDTATLNVNTGMILLSPGDQVTVSSINLAPEMSGRRMFTGSL